MSKPLKRENRGGARPGSGRKPFIVSEREIAKLLKAARKMEKETGLSPQAFLMAEIRDPSDKDKRNRMVALKIYFDKVTVKQSHDVKEVHNFAAPVLLPVQDADPARPEVVATVN